MSDDEVRRETKVLREGCEGHQLPPKNIERGAEGHKLPPLSSQGKPPTGQEQDGKK